MTRSISNPGLDNCVSLERLCEINMRGFNALQDRGIDCLRYLCRIGSDEATRAYIASFIAMDVFLDTAMDQLDTEVSPLTFDEQWALTIAQTTCRNVWLHVQSAIGELYKLVELETLAGITKAGGMSRQLLDESLAEFIEIMKHF